MIVFWLFLSALTAFLSILVHSLFVRYLDPRAPSHLMKRFWLSFAARLLLIGGFFWQLVQQKTSILITGVIVFLIMYAGSLYYIIKWKPQWFQPKLQKDVSVWMP